MLRHIGFGILALLVLFACVMAGDALSARMYPPPAGLDVKDTEALKAYAAQVPALALVIMLIAHLIGALLGGWIMGRFSASMSAGLVVAGLMMLAGVCGLLMVPHPTWFWLDAFVYVPAAMLGFRLGHAPGGV